MFKRVLVLLEDQPSDQVAIRRGVEVAAAGGGEVIFFHLLPDFDVMPIVMHEAVIPRPLEYERQMRARASASLNRASAIAESHGVFSSRSMASAGSFNEAECVSDVAEKRRCDVIVVGTDTRNAVLRLIGRSIVPGLISHAKVPVLVCQVNPVASPGTRMSRIKRPYRRRNAAPQSDQPKA